MKIMERISLNRHADRHFRNHCTLLLNEPRANAYLERLGLHGLVSSSRENTSYLTNFLSVTHVQDRMYNVAPGSGENYMQVYGLFPRRDKPVLILPAAMYMFSQFENGITDRIYAYGKPISLVEDRLKFEARTEGKDERELDASVIFDTPGLALRAAVKEYVDGTRLGVDYSDLAPASEKELLSLGKTRLFNATELFRFIRLVKSPEEIRRLRTSAKINERGMGSMLDAIRPGASEIDLMKAYAETIVSESAKFDPGYILCPSGARGSDMMRPTNRKMKSGDRVWVDVICSHNGYFSDTGESASIGKADPEQVRVYDTMKKVIETAQDAARPGVRPSELSKGVEILWDRANLGRPPITLGHGIGLETHEYPQLSSSNEVGDRAAIHDDAVSSSADIPLEEGMVLNLESAYLVKSWGGVHLEKTVVVGKSGSAPIIEQKRHLRIRL
jgi:Xaa-Pro aminopeptidase